MKRGIKILLSGTAVALVAFYILIVVILPFLLNSKPVVSKIISIVELKTGMKPDVFDLRFKISPDFRTQMKAGRISVEKEGGKILGFDGFSLEINPFKKNETKISADYIYYKIQPSKSENKKSSGMPDFSRELPEISVKNAQIEIAPKTIARFNSVLLKNNELSFNLNFSSDFLSESLSAAAKDKIKLDKNGVSVDNFHLYSKKGGALLSGNYGGKGYNFKIKGKNLPVYDIEKLALSLMKMRANKKVFIENFTDFSGGLDIDLTANNEGLFGEVIINKLRAKSVPLSVPMAFNKLVFDFEKDKIFMTSNGVLGGMPAEWSFYLTGIMTPDMEISGGVNSNITNDFAKNYIDGLFIRGAVGLNVDYLVKNGTVDILYSAKIPAQSDIAYNGAYLGLSDTARSVNASTSKNGDVLTLTNYDYSVRTGDKEEEIIFGNAVFSKKNGKFSMDKITGKTKKDAPVSLLGFIENRLIGGVFNGDLEYNFDENKLFGTISLQNSRFKGFKIKDAAIFGGKQLSILADGTFKGEPFGCEIELKNELKKEFYIFKLDLFLNKYVMGEEKNKRAQKRKLPDNFSIPRAENAPKVTVENFNMQLNEFRRGKIAVDNIVLTGMAKDHVLHFTMPSTYFADGVLTASGFADFNNQILNIDFGAKDIDANIAASQVFNLENRFEGKTAAKLHLEIPSKLTSLKGHGWFEIKEGSIKDIGSKEFVIKRAKRKRPFSFSISDIVKVDESVSTNPNSAISGDFDIFNEQIKNANLFLQNDSFSLFIEGGYNAKTGNSNVDIWGRYDTKIERNISILHIPLGWLLKIVFRANETKNAYMEKILKIPNVRAADTKEYKIGLEGNINNIKDLKIVFKRLD